MAENPHGANEQHTDELLDHNYDGIQEYDNPIPGWWHLIFLGTVVFSLCYVVVLHMTPIVPSREQRWANAEARAQEIQFGKLREMPMGEDKIRAVMGNEQWLGSGAAIFAGVCSVCHGADGAGKDRLGFNLTDEKYVNVQNLMDIAAMIQNGSSNKVMPPQTQLDENEVALVAGYVATLRGQNIEGPASAAVGEPIAPFPDPITDVEAADAEDGGEG